MPLQQKDLFCCGTFLSQRPGVSQYFNPKDLKMKQGDRLEFMATLHQRAGKVREAVACTSLHDTAPKGYFQDKTSGDCLQSPSSLIILTCTCNMRITITE